MEKQVNCTKLEKIVYALSDWRRLPEGFGADKQKRIDDHNRKILDVNAESIVLQLSDHDLCESIVEIYDSTAPEYQANKHNQDVVDEIIKFMELVPEGSRGLDVGCGNGRDTLFMSIADDEFRQTLMNRKKDGKTTLEKYPVPKGSYRVIGIDSAAGMLKAAREWKKELERFSLGADHPRYPYFLNMDIHNIDARDEINERIEFDFIWACASLFTHTPYSYLEPAIESVVNSLRPGGIFFTSYTQKGKDRPYNKLKLSSTGRVKWFSHPNPEEIIALARKYGLELLEEPSFDDYKHGRDYKESLFVSHFFKKK